MKKPSTPLPQRRTKSADSTSATAIPNININDPRHRHAVSAIPFSWEQHPGIAKPTTETKAITKPTIQTKAITKPTIQAKASTSENVSPKSLLPPPPPILLSNIPIRLPKKSSSTAIMTTDPFEIALAECAKVPPTPPGLMEEIWGCKMVEPQRARWRFGLSCNMPSACSIVDSKVHVPRAGVQTASCRILSHGRLM